jgi:hypothetical protein
MANDMTQNQIIAAALAEHDASPITPEQAAQQKADAYAEANEFDDTKRRIDLEQLAADEYQKHKDNGVSDRLLVRAMAVIAAAFYEPGNPYEDRDGVTHVYNDLDFQQKSALGNMCNNARWLMDSAAQRVTELYTQLDQQEAVFDGSDNAIYAINRTLDQIDRCTNTQIPTLRKYGPVTRAAYYAIRGEHWTPPVKKGQSAAELNKSATLERLRRARQNQTA